MLLAFAGSRLGKTEEDGAWDVEREGAKRTK